MYSVLKNNCSLVYKTKYIVNGGKLLQRYSSLCSLNTGKISSRLYVSKSNERSQSLNGKSCGLLVKTNNNVNNSIVKHLQTGRINLYAVEPGKPSSKVEETVCVIKEKQKEKAKEKLGLGTKEDTTTKAIVVKKSWKKRIMDELTHYYHGFRLLFIDINVSRKLVWRLLKGYSLTRREHKLLVRTVGDLFRLVPFSVFIIVPFLEFTLPFFIKFFPGFLPTTFETSKEKEDKMQRSLKVKIEMAKFLQRTLDDMAVSSKGHSSEAAKEFAQFFEQVRTSGNMTTSEDIMKFSKLFEDEITLDSLPRPQLMALCRVLDMNPIGTTNFLRFQLRLKLRSLAADDMMIHLEGVDSLSQAELQAACRARGMRALGVSEERLKAQLNQWLDLSLVKKVPPSLLLLSQAFMLPETTPTEEKLAATIQALPDAVCTATKAVIGEREGKVDYKTKIEMIKEEVAMIKEERLEEKEEQAKLKQLEAKEEEKRAEEALIDKAPTLVDKAKQLDPAFRAAVEEMKHAAVPEKLVSDEAKLQLNDEQSKMKHECQVEVTTKDIEAIENALDTLSKGQKKLIVEKEELLELREEMKEYQEDVADLQKLMTEVGKEMDIKETKAAQRLFRKVNNMICKMEDVLKEVQNKQAAAEQNEKMAVHMNEEDKSKQISKSAGKQMETTTKTGDVTLRIDDLISTIRKLHSKEDTSRLERIKEVLSKMDADHDGSVRVDVVLKIIDLVGHESVKLSKKQVDELISLIDKEEVLEKECERKKEAAAAIQAASSNDTSCKGSAKNNPDGSTKESKKGVSPVVTTTASSNKSKDNNDNYSKIEPLTTLTATIKSPQNSTNALKSIAEPIRGIGTPKNLR